MADVPIPESARNAYNLLMTTRQPRLHRHVYFGVPIKLIAIFLTFFDLLVNVFPVIFAPQRFQLIFFAVAFASRVGALYTVFQPKIKHLNVYRSILIISALVSFSCSIVHLLLALLSPRNGCHKLDVEHAFAVTGVYTPIQMVIFMAISAYISCIEEEEANKQPPPYSTATEPATETPTPQHNQQSQTTVDEEAILISDS
ncbi:hypothetical protein M3Y94_00998800 [Aphelenchoides besseyi]|nr:hypothetical protein M3Y94_00998800 [Aphelenchoides besseyi]KAI6221234.1 hypothetical protein M3Y95_01018800 [Aphelenchoides besseyi]